MMSLSRPALAILSGSLIGVSQHEASISTRRALMPVTSAPSAETTKLDPLVRGALVVAAMLAAWFIFGLGLLSPLTPSEGRTPWHALILWFAAPLALLVLVVRYVRSWLLRGVTLLQLLMMLMLGGWVLSWQY